VRNCSIDDFCTKDKGKGGLPHQPKWGGGARLAWRKCARSSTANLVKARIFGGQGLFRGSEGGERGNEGRWGRGNLNPDRPSGKGPLIKTD